MEHHLVPSAEGADYLLELSNVVRQTSIGPRGPRSLRRLGLVLRALMELTGDPDVSVYLVADTSLLGGHREFGDDDFAVPGLETGDEDLVCAGVEGAAATTGSDRGRTLQSG